MPAPNASFILSMLNPYQGFRPDSSGAINLAQLGEQRVARQERSRQFDLENERANKYFGLQEQQFKTREANDLRDKQISAYTRFQAAVDSGDTEQADLALNELSMLGVGVEKYGGAQGAPKAPPAPAAPTPAQAALGASAAANPALSVQKPPMSKADAATDQALDKLARDATVSDGSPSAGYSMDAMGEAPTVRPGRSGGPPTEAPSAPVTPPDQGMAQADAGPRPTPARTDFIKGQEPAMAGEATPEQSLIQGYRLKFKDASGQERVVDIDPQSIAERQRQRVAGVFDPLVQSAQTPQEKQAALQAKYTALQAVGTVKPEAAVKMGMDFYEHTLDRGAKENRAKIVSGRGGTGPGFGGMETSKGEQQRSLNAAKYVESIVNKEQAENNVKGIREELAMGQDLLSKANSPTGLGQFASKATLQKILMKGTLSDKDVQRLENATGVYNRVVQWVNNWSGDGQVPKDVLDAIKLITVEKNKILRERLLEAGNRVEDRIRKDPFLRNVATPEEIDESANREFETTTGLKKKKTKRVRGSLETPEAPAGKEPKRKATGASNAAARRLLGK